MSLPLPIPWVPAPAQGQTSGLELSICSIDNCQAQSYRRRGSVSLTTPGEAKHQQDKPFRGISGPSPAHPLQQSHPLPHPRRLQPPPFLGGAGPAARAPAFPESGLMAGLFFSFHPAGAEAPHPPPLAPPAPSLTAKKRSRPFPFLCG